MDFSTMAKELLKNNMVRAARKKWVKDWEGTVTRKYIDLFTNPYMFNVYFLNVETGSYFQEKWELNADDLLAEDWFLIPLTIKELSSQYPAVRMIERNNISISS